VPVVQLAPLRMLVPWPLDHPYLGPSLVPQVPLSIAVE
jgi:hypothetical protein